MCSFSWNKVPHWNCNVARLLGSDNQIGLKLYTNKFLTLPLKWRTANLSKDISRYTIHSDCKIDWTSLFLHIYCLVSQMCKQLLRNAFFLCDCSSFVYSTIVAISSGVKHWEQHSSSRVCIRLPKQNQTKRCFQVSVQVSNKSIMVYICIWKNVSKITNSF